MGWANSPQRRSIQVNGQLLAYYRKQRGWTQREAAHASGYSLRLIRKAEAGRALHPDTIEVLADTYCTSRCLVFPEDLISTPMVMAQRLLDSYVRDGRQLVHNIEPILDPDMTFHYSGDESEIPFAGTHRGIDGFDRFWGKFFGSWKPTNEQIFRPKLVADGGDVYSFAIDRCQSPGMREPVTTFLVQHFQFSRGRIRHLDVKVDTQAIAVYLRLAGKTLD